MSDGGPQLPDEHVDVPMEREIGSQVPKIAGSDIYRSIEANRGNLSAVAAELGVRRSYIVERVNTTPDLKVLVEDLREAVVDKAEDNIFTSVDKGDDAMSRFVASTLGKARGWTQGVSGEKGGPLEVVIRKLGDAPSDA
jgi:hypothetical protein